MAITKNREEVLGNADIVIDITDVADIKLNALRAHRTQTEGMLRELEQKLKTKNQSFKNGLMKKFLDVSME